MERQRFVAFHLAKSRGYATTMIHIVLSAALLRKYAYGKIVTMSHNERRQSVNDTCAGILDNRTGMERTYTPLNLSAAFIDKNASDYIASASYK
jgi:diphthamide biosynthesis methyltransferase